MAGTTEHRCFAWCWDRMSRMMDRGPVGRMRADLLRDVEGDVLEIGAGTGSNFAHYSASARVIAVEPDRHMLKRARERATPNIELRQAPAEALPAPDASCDAVVSTLVLCSVHDVPRALAEIRRVLRPDGKLLFMEHVRGDGLLGRVHDMVQPMYGWFAGGCHANRRTEPSIRDAGFVFEHIEHAKLNPYSPAIVGVAVVARDG